MKFYVNLHNKKRLRIVRNIIKKIKTYRHAKRMEKKKLYNYFSRQYVFSISLMGVFHCENDFLKMVQKKNTDKNCAPHWAIFSRIFLRVEFHILFLQESTVQL